MIATAANDPCFATPLVGLKVTNGRKRERLSFHAVTPLLLGLYLCSATCTGFPLQILSSSRFHERRDLWTLPAAWMMAARSDKTVIKWGIVGLGDVTQKKSGPPFYKCKGSELVAVMRRTPGKAAEWALRVPGGKCRGYDNLEEFLQHDGLDAVYVATRPGSHLEVCRKVASYGKAVYVEKPVGRCAAETRAIIQACQESGSPLYTAYISRAYERTRAIRRLLAEGSIGDRVTSVTYGLVGSGGASGMDEKLPWRLDAQQSGGGLIMDVGCHVIDRIDWICGPLVEVAGTAKKLGQGIQNVEDCVSLKAEIGESAWASIPCVGADVSCSWDFSGGTRDQGECDELKISGPQGSLRMGAMSPSAPVFVLDTNGAIVRQLTFGAPEHTAMEMIQAVTDDLLGVGSEQFISRGENALRTSTVLDKILSPYYGERPVGFWSSPEKWPGIIS